MEPTHPSALVEADVDGALEEDEVALGELEGLELRPQRVALVRSLKVLEQVRVHGAPAKAEGGKEVLADNIFIIYFRARTSQSDT